MDLRRLGSLTLMLGVTAIVACSGGSSRSDGGFDVAAGASGRGGNSPGGRGGSGVGGGTGRSRRCGCRKRWRRRDARRWTGRWLGWWRWWHRWPRRGNGGQRWIGGKWFGRGWRRDRHRGAGWHRRGRRGGLCWCGGRRRKRGTRRIVGDRRKRGTRGIVGHWRTTRWFLHDDRRLHGDAVCLGHQLHDAVLELHRWTLQLGVHGRT